MQEKISNKATKAAQAVPTIVVNSILAMLLFVLMPVSESIADSATSIDEPVSTEAGRIARGGRLYDKWFAVNGAEKPADTHGA